MTASAAALLGHLVDYAGLFPPAALSMHDAAQRYAVYHAGPRAWMLGRFVVPVTRLGEFAGIAEPLLPVASEPWRLSVLLAPDADAGVAAVAAFNASHRGAVCDAVEGKAATPDDVARIARAAHGAGLAAYVEVPVDDDPLPIVDAISARGARAKIRTGGTAVDAFPTAEQVIRFLGACVRSKTPFKATAGLHHAITGDYRLTYDESASQGMMFGFLNVFLAAALLRDGGGDDDAGLLLADRDSTTFVAADDGIRWRGYLFLTARLAQLRDTVAMSFGSCSFTEPVDDLTALGLL